MTEPTTDLRRGDALVLVDIQNDFLPGGALAVAGGDAILGPVGRWIDQFARSGLPIFATRDWHPPNHCSFREQGGMWPVHCVANRHGSAYPESVRLPQDAEIISKGTEGDQEAYSGFAGTDLADRLKSWGVRRIFVAGLATDYCVLHTVLDARKHGFDVTVIERAIRAVDVEPGDGQHAIERMAAAGASILRQDVP